MRSIPNLILPSKSDAAAVMVTPQRGGIQHGTPLVRRFQSYRTSGCTALGDVDRHTISGVRATRGGAVCPIHEDDRSRQPPRSLNRRWPLTSPGYMN